MLEGKVFSFDDKTKMKKVSVFIDYLGQDNKPREGIGLVIRGHSDNDDTTRLRMIFNSVLDTLFDGKFRCSIQTVEVEKDASTPTK